MLTGWLVLLGCADITRIDEGQRYNAVIPLKDWFTSAYLLQTDAGAILFDAGYRASHIRRDLDRHGVAPEDVAAVFLTHGHTDHLGALEILPGVPVAARPEEAPLLREESAGRVTIDTPLEDGQLLSYGPYTVEVFAIDGHTAGSAAYLVDGVLLLGDSAIIQRDGSLDMVPDDRSDDPALLRASLLALAERLEPRAEEIDWLVPAHSAGVAGLEPLLDFADR